MAPPAWFKVYDTSFCILRDAVAQLALSNGHLQSEVTAVLGPLIRDAVKTNKGLLDVVHRHGWHNNEFSGPVDLRRLQTSLLFY